MDSIQRNGGSDQTGFFQQTVLEAIGRRTPLRVVGGDTKAFLGAPGVGDPLSTLGHIGIIEYEPTELVITARAGTPLSVVENLLAEQGQVLSFEPPHYGTGCTIGGAVASGLSGPGRPYAGAVRDHVLGVTYINGLGQVLAMGGKVMKNVAGFDVSRLMAGSFGTLGVILEVSLRVAPLPEVQQTQVLELDIDDALKTMRELTSTCAPITGLCHHGGRMYVRVCGNARVVAETCKQVGGSRLDSDGKFWCDLRDQRHRFFTSSDPLWRLSVPPAAEHTVAFGACWIDWGGALRWLAAPSAASEIFDMASRLQGHVCRFRGRHQHGEMSQPLVSPLAKLNRNIKHAFDPYGVFNSRHLGLAS